MENIKIGIDCHNLEGQRTGVGRYLWNLLKEWVQKDFVYNVSDSINCIQLFLYFKNEIPNDVTELAQKINTPVGWRIYSKCLNGRSNALFKHWLLPRAAAQDKIDVLFCPDYVLPIYLPKRIKTSVTIHDIIYEARPNEYSWPSFADKILLKWTSKQSAKKAGIICVPSEFTKDEILKHYKVNPKKIVVTPLAPDPIFKKLDLSKQHKYILFISSIFNRRFIPQKIQGFGEFAKTHPEFQFLIIGKNHTKPYQDIGALVAQANRELGRKAITWKKYIENDEELARLYQNAFATLWCSSYEGFGLPILESMACGTPVIACRSGSLPEVAGDAALYVENPENPAEIMLALEKLTNDSVCYNRLCDLGLARAQKFSWQKCAEATLNIILKLL